MAATSPLHGSRALVTGAAGFLGRYVTAALKGAGARVHALLGPPGCGGAADSGAYLCLEADICDSATIARLAAGVDIVVHLAGLSSVAGSFNHAPEYVRVHTEGTASVLDACRTAVCRFVHVSSAEVYGRPQTDPVAEEHRLEARSPYGAAKIGAEKMVEAYVNSFGLNAVVLRPFSIYGPGASPDSLVASIVRLCREGRPVALRDLRPVRDYCFVADFADVVVQACVSAVSGFQVFNVGTMQGVSVKEVADAVINIMELELPVLEKPAEKRPANSEIYRLVADNRRIQSAFGWKPRISLEEGLKVTVRNSSVCAV
jgi:nucleoside-diphosphate-sugar epimerase